MSATFILNTSTGNYAIKDNARSAFLISDILSIGEIGQLSDVDLTGTSPALASNHFMVYNGTSWIHKQPSDAIISLGITATAAELNLLDGVTASTDELNYLDVTTLGTSEASKAVTVDANGDLIIPDSDKFQFGAGLDMTLYHDGIDSYLTNQTGTLKIATETSGVPIIIGHSTSEVTIGDNLSVTGDLTVNGTTTTINSTVTTLDDPIITLGGDAAPSSDDNKDRGVEFRWHDGSNAKVGFFGYDDSTSKFTFIPDATNASEVFTGNAGDVSFGAGEFTGNVVLDNAKSLVMSELNSNGSNTVSVKAPDAVASDVVLTLPVTTGNLVSTGDSTVITNAMLAGSIADSKLNTISTADKVSLAALDLDGAADIGADLVDADLIAIDDGATGTNRKSELTRIKKYIYSAMSGDAAASDAGVLTIANDSIETSMVNKNVITGQTAKTSIHDDDVILLSDSQDLDKLKKMTKANFVAGLSGTSTLASLSDTDITSPVAGNMLIHDGTDSFDNVAMSGHATIASNGALTLHKNAISTQSALAALSNTDEFLIHDTTPGALKRMGVSLLQTYMQNNLTFATSLDTLSDVAITSAASGHILVHDGASNFDNVAMSGDITISASGVTTIAAGAVDFAMIAPAAVVIESEGIGSNDNDTTLPTSAAVKDYVDSQVSGAGLDIDGYTSSVVTLAQDDLFVVSDASATGTEKKITFSNFEDSIFSNISGDATVAAGGALTIAANSVALGTDTTGDFVGTITAGTGLTSTGATSGEGIAHSLSVNIGSDVQAYDAQLDTLAGFTAAQVTRGIADDNLLTIDDADAAANDYVRLTAVGAEGRSYSEVRTDLGLVIGTNVQAYDADLAALAGLTSAADKGIQFTGSGTAATYDLTAAGKALLDDADAAAQRTTLGLGTGDSPTFVSLSLSGQAAPLDLGNQKITSLGSPSSASDAASKSYVDSVAAGLDIYDSVRAATTASFTMASTASTTTLVLADGEGGFNATANTLTIDGISLAQDSRVLIKDGVNSNSTGVSNKWNGIYTVGDLTAASLTLTRASDMDIASEFNTGAFFFVEQGTTNADAGFVLTTDGTITVGTTDIVFTQFSGAGQVIAGDALTKSGNTLNVGVDDSSIEINADALRVKAAGITNAMLAGSIADSNLSTISTANKVSLSAIDLDGAADIGADLVDADLIVVDDGAAGTNKKSTLTRIKKYIYSAMSGDATASDAGALTIAAGAVENSMLASGAITASDIAEGSAAVTLTTTTGNITIDAQGNNSDIIFKGTDGGIDTTFLTIDGSEGGTATFNNDIKLQSDVSRLYFGADDDVYITHQADSGLQLRVDPDGNTDPRFVLYADHTAAGGPELRFQHSGMDAANDIVGKIDFWGKDDSAAQRTSGDIKNVVADIGQASWKTNFVHNVYSAGSVTTALEIRGSATSGESIVDIKDHDGSASGLALNGTVVTSTAAELNILDGVTSTTAEINLLDGATSATSTTLVDADRVIVNDSGTMKQVALSDVKTYVGAGGSATIPDIQVLTTSTPVSAAFATSGSNGDNERVYLVNNGSTAVQIDLPAVSGNTGKKFQIKRLGTANVTIAVQTGESLETTTNGTFVLTSQYSSVTVVCNASGTIDGWYII